MELKRDIYAELLNWKKENSGHVLELRGARQVGKTYILDKFSRENYKIFIYINMAQTSGREFLDCLKIATDWEPGTPRRNRPLHEAFRLFDELFQDTEDTVVVIDEIQESARAYSLIRQFAREFSCHFIVTGSYLGKTINYAMSWLYRSHMIGFCGQANECSPIETSLNRRFYFTDVGVCRYFLSASGADAATVRGLVNENFVYIDLLKRTLNQELAWTMPMFGTYKGGEIDFFVRSRRNDRNYAVEVKAGRAVGKTAQQLVKDGKVEAVYFLKGDTCGGVEGRMLTVPVYLVGRVAFEYRRA